jgi:hypothetical protein
MRIPATILALCLAAGGLPRAAEAVAILEFRGELEDSTSTPVPVLARLSVPIIQSPHVITQTVILGQTAVQVHTTLYAYSSLVVELAGELFSSDGPGEIRQREGVDVGGLVVPDEYSFVGRLFPSTGPIIVAPHSPITATFTISDRSLNFIQGTLKVADGIFASPVITLGSLFPLGDAHFLLETATAASRGVITPVTNIEAVPSRGPWRC